MIDKFKMTLDNDGNNGFFFFSFPWLIKKEDFTFLVVLAVQQF